VSGGTDGAAPTADLSGARAAHRSLRRTLATIRDDDIGRASHLPGWTIGHVLTHIARNADGHCNMFAGAALGEIHPQYPGGTAQRTDEIERGAHRGAAAIVADVETTMAALEARWDAATDEMWSSGRCRSFGGEMPLAIQPFRRWREVEIHHHDLGTAFSWNDWPDAYVGREFEATLATLPPRISGPLALRATDSALVWTVPEDSCSVVEVRGPQRQLLAWLVGRHDDPRYPKLGPWL
jgi:maleylpyruvate isomerase